MQAVAGTRSKDNLDLIPAQTLILKDPGQMAFLPWVSSFPHGKERTEWFLRLFFILILYDSEPCRSCYFLEIYLLFSPLSLAFVLTLYKFVNGNYYISPWKTLFHLYIATYGTKTAIAYLFLGHILENLNQLGEKYGNYSFLISL